MTTADEMTLVMALARAFKEVDPMATDDAAFECANLMVDVQDTVSKIGAELAERNRIERQTC